MSRLPPAEAPGASPLPLATDWALAAFAEAPIGMAVTAPSGPILRCNRAFARMLGCTPEELGAVDWATITHPDDVEPSRAVVERLLSGEASSERFEKRYVGKGGRVVHADVSTNLLRDPDGRPLGFVTHVADVTRRREGEPERAQEAVRELAESERLLRQVQELAGLGAYRLDARTGTWTSSSTLDRIFGIGPGYVRDVESRGWSAEYSTSPNDAGARRRSGRGASSSRGSSATRRSTRSSRTSRRRRAGSASRARTTTG